MKNVIKRKNISQRLRKDTTDTGLRLMYRHQAGRGPGGRGQGGRGQGGPLSAADIEWLNLQEAIQMSQALEESMRLYEEQNKMAPPDEGLRVSPCL